MKIFDLHDLNNILEESNTNHFLKTPSPLQRKIKEQAQSNQSYNRKNKEKNP